MAQIATELTVPLAGVQVPAFSFLRMRALLWLAALTSIVGVAAASYLAYTGNVATYSYNIQRLHAERELWRTRNDQLRVELGKVRSLTWVENEAVSRLKMQKAVNPVYLRMDGAR